MEGSNSPKVVPPLFNCHWSTTSSRALRGGVLRSITSMSLGAATRRFSASRSVRKTSNDGNSADGDADGKEEEGGG